MNLGMSEIALLIVLTLLQLPLALFALSIMLGVLLYLLFEGALWLGKTLRRGDK